MKNIVRYFIIALCCASLIPWSRAEEPKTLEEALLNYKWQWIHVNNNKGLSAPKELHFHKAGFVTTSLGETWDSWKIIDPQTVHCHWVNPTLPGGSGTIAITFGKGFTTCSADVGKNYEQRGKRLGFIAPDEALRTTTYKPDQSQIKILSDESVNVTSWITAPLDVAVPEQIWENLNLLKEALKDEAAQKPVATPAAYQLGVKLCLKMLENLAERDTASTRAGGNAVLHQKSNLTQQNRDHLTWPQYALERDERKERKDNARNADKFMNGHFAVEWNNKTTNTRKEMQAMYAHFREALRQQPTVK